MLGSWVQCPLDTSDIKRRYSMKNKICKRIGCGKIILVGNHGKVYCSTECRKKTTESRVCARPGCDNLIPREKDSRQKYCSRTCAALKNNEPRKKHKHCFYCNKDLPHNAHGDYPKFCSIDCRNDYNFEIRVNGGFRTGIFRARSYYIRKRWVWMRNM